MHNMFRVVWTSRLFCLKHTTRVKTTVDCVVLFFLRRGCLRYWFVILRYWFVHVLPAEASNQRSSSVFKQSGKGSYAIRAQNQLDGKIEKPLGEKSEFKNTSFRPLVSWNQQSSLRKTVDCVLMQVIHNHTVFVWKQVLKHYLFSHNHLLICCFSLTSWILMCDNELKKIRTIKT